MKLSLLTALLIFADSAHAGDLVIDHPWVAPRTIQEDRISRLESNIGLSNMYWKFDATRSDKSCVVWYEIRAANGQFRSGKKFLLGSAGPKQGFLAHVTKGQQFLFATPIGTVANVVRRKDLSNIESSKSDYSEYDKGFLLRFYDTTEGKKVELYRIRWQIQQAEQDGADQSTTAPEEQSQGEEKPKPESEVRPQ